MLVCGFVRACVRACVHACLCECVRACVCESHMKVLVSFT